MAWSSDHIKWLTDTGERINTADGKEVEVWELNHEVDPPILSAWAMHFRNHYCADEDIDYLRGASSRKDYLNEMKFPCSKTAPGPSIRAGDFGEILVADYLEFLMGFWVPRFRWSSKIIRNESPKGSDVIGFRLGDKDKFSPDDTLIVVEAKTKFSAANNNRLQVAINDSAKDPRRLGESLNFIKQKLFDKQNVDDMLRVERFQSPVDQPYKEIYSAAAIVTEEHFDKDEIMAADCGNIPKGTKGETICHPKYESLKLVVIKGVDMMTLVNNLYEIAANEA